MPIWRTRAFQPVPVKTYLLILLAVLLVSCGQRKQQLNILAWPEDLDPKLIAEFAEQFNCKVNIDGCSTSEMMMAKIDSGGDSVYDIVAPVSDNLATMIRRGLLAPLRHENIPNLKNIDPTFADPSVDPGMQFAIPYQWGSGGLYVRKPVGKAIEGWVNFMFQRCAECFVILCAGEGWWDRAWDLCR